MIDYTVHEPPQIAATRDERAESLVFVKDGFAWGALVFGPFYFLFRGEWLGLTVYLFAALLLRLGFSTAGAEEYWTSLAAILLNIVAGFEANEIKRWSLSLRGWREIGAVSGRSYAESERRFLEKWLETEPRFTPEAWRVNAIAKGISVDRVEQGLRSYAAGLRAKYATRAPH